jgi:hypothetical protein
LRKVKPTKLKENVESKTHQAFDAKQFFGKVSNMVPVLHVDNDPTAVIEPSNPSSSKQLHLVETQFSTQEFSKTPPLPFQEDEKTQALGVVPDKTQTKASQPKKKSTAKWIDPSRVEPASPAPKKKKKESSALLPMLCVAAALGLGAFALLGGTPSGVISKVDGQKLTPQQLQERIAYHQKTTGWKLNNERIETQIENHYQAPGLPYNAQKVKPPDMMNGLPLEGEHNLREGSRDKTLPVNPSYADAKIMYGLQEEQDLIETEKRARQEYIKEFISNAAKDGYAVDIDEFGNVQASKLKGQGPQLPEGDDSYNDN